MRMMRAYCTPYAYKSPSAFNNLATEGSTANPISARTTPIQNVNATRKVKYEHAFSFSPSPNVRETMALPPAPSMKPTAPIIIKKGIIRLMAAKGVFPAKLETNSPSTTP